MNFNKIVPKNIHSYSRAVLFNFNTSPAVQEGRENKKNKKTPTHKAIIIPVLCWRRSSEIILWELFLWHMHKCMILPARCGGKDEKKNTQKEFSFSELMVHEIRWHDVFDSLFLVLTAKAKERGRERKKKQLCWAGKWSRVARMSRYLWCRGGYLSEYISRTSISGYFRSHLF